MVMKKDQKVLYIQLDKALLYGCVQSAQLWYKLYSSNLKDMVFELNPYDMCAVNTYIEGIQCTLFWYMDDNMISHVDPNVVNKVIKMIEENFGKIPQTRGDEHDFMGMNIKFKDKKVKIRMKNISRKQPTRLWMKSRGMRRHLQPATYSKHARLKTEREKVREISQRSGITFYLFQGDSG